MKKLTYLFIGEEPSLRALSLGVSWRDGALCSGTLHRALQACGIDPVKQHYWNWFTLTPDQQRELLWYAEQYQQVIVALGQRVHRALKTLEVEHLQMIHPAARGAIRKTENYHAHVKSVLVPSGSSSSKKRR